MGLYKGQNSSFLILGVYSIPEPEKAVSGSVYIQINKNVGYFHAKVFAELIG